MENTDLESICFLVFSLLSSFCQVFEIEEGVRILYEVLSTTAWANALLIICVFVSGIDQLLLLGAKFAMPAFSWFSFTFFWGVEIPCHE